MVSGVASVPARGAAKDKSKSANAITADSPQWTITCQVFSGPSRVSDAKRAKDYWASQSGLPGFYVVHEAAQSTLYYGYYRSIDPGEKKDANVARADRAKLDTLTGPQGERPFRGCVFMPLVTQDPAAPPEWNLANSKGYWSLQIGVYKDSPLRKQAAVDAVRIARESGIEAYYYHGQSASSVCIGSWPRSAVKEQEAAVGGTVDPETPILVSPEPLNLGTIRQKTTDKKIKQMAPKVEPLDPTLVEAMKAYPDHLVNGDPVVKNATDVNGNQVKIPAESYLVLVPHNVGGTVQDADAPPVPPAVAEQGGSSQQLPSAFRPPEPAKPKAGAGKLKSFDGN
jgi:hypothetical protein